MCPTQNSVPPWFSDWAPRVPIYAELQLTFLIFEQPNITISAILWCLRNPFDSKARRRLAPLIALPHVRVSSLDVAGEPGAVEQRGARAVGRELGFCAGEQVWIARKSERESLVVLERMGDQRGQTDRVQKTRPDPP